MLHRSIVKFGFSPNVRDILKESSCEPIIEYCPLSDYSLIQTFQPLFIYVNTISKNLPVTVLCDSISYNACIKYHLETGEHKNNTFLRVEKNVKYLKMSNFMNYPEAILAIHMNIGNSASFIFPRHLMSKNAIANNKDLHIKTSDFDISSIIGATKYQHEKLMTEIIYWIYLVKLVLLGSC
jgi:hypothetical protein